MTIQRRHKDLPSGKTLVNIREITTKYGVDFVGKWFIGYDLGKVAATTEALKKLLNAKDKD